MEKKNLIDRLIVRFKEETKSIADKFEDCTYSVELYFKNNNPANGVHSIDAIFEFEEYILRLEYKLNVSILLPKGLLEMRIMFKNGSLPVEYSIYDILDIIKNEDFKCYTLPYINSEKKMTSGLKYLLKAFQKYKNRIEKIVEDNSRIHELELNVDNKIFMFLNERIFKTRSVEYLTRMLELYYVLDAARFTNDMYLNVCRKNYKKAIKKYSKLNGKLTIYEQRLINYINENEIKDILPNNLKTLENMKKLRYESKNLIGLYLSWLILTPICTIPYVLVFLISYLVLNKGAIYTSFSNIPVTIFCGFITAITISYFCRKKIYKTFFRKNKEELLALYEIENTNGANRFMMKVLQFIIAASIVITVFMANTNLQFRENEFVDNLNFFSIKGKQIEYSNVEKVYKVYSNNTETEYVILLKNGDKIDMYYDLSEYEINKYILPIFEKKNILVEKKTN